MNGKIEIAREITAGMIKIGTGSTGIFDKRYQRTLIELGGTIIFDGRAQINHGSRISVLKGATLQLGDTFMLNVSVIICADSIKIGHNVTISWETLIMDTDFHHTINTLTGVVNNKITAPIVIGNNNWIGLRCIILKGTETPNWCIVGAGSRLNKVYDIPEKSLLAGSPAVLKKENIIIE